MTNTLRQILLGWSSRGGWDERDMLHAGFWWGNPEGKDGLEDQGVGERLMLKWWNRLEGRGMDTCGWGKGQLVASYEHGNETSASIGYEKFFGNLRAYYLLEVSVPWN